MGTLTVFLSLQWGQLSPGRRSPLTYPDKSSTGLVQGSLGSTHTNSHKAYPFPESF